MKIHFRSYINELITIVGFLELSALMLSLIVFPHFLADKGMNTCGYELLSVYVG